MIRLEGKMLALLIRRDRTPTVLRKLAKMESDARVARRILAIANVALGLLAFIPSANECGWRGYGYYGYGGCGCGYAGYGYGYGYRPIYAGYGWGYGPYWRGGWGYRGWGYRGWGYRGGWGRRW